MTYQFTARPLTLFSNTVVLPNFIASCNFFYGGLNAILKFDLVLGAF